MKILVTGATGFVGRNLIPAIKDDNKVSVIVRDKNKASKLFGNGINIYELEDTDVWNHSYDMVFHLAAYLSSAEDSRTLDALLEANILFGTRLLNELKSNPPGLFVNFGTFAEYRLGPMEIHNAYLYSATKSAFKEILRFYSEKYDFKYINVNPYTIYGGVDSQKKVIDILKESTNALKPLKMSEGRQVLDFIHVNDVVSFLVHILQNYCYFSSCALKDFHLGTGKGTSLREVAEIIQTKSNKKCNVDWGALPYRKFDVMYAVAPQGPFIESGWSSSIKLEDAL